MPLNTNELLKAAEIVAENKDVKVAVKGSLRGAGITAASTFVGGLVAGPVGLAAGATFGGLVAYSVTKDKFKPVVQILREDLNNRQKEALAFHIQQSLKDVGLNDFVKLCIMLSSNEAIAMIIWNCVKNYLEKELQCKIKPLKGE